MQLTVPAIRNRGNGPILNAGVSPGASLTATVNYTLTDFASGHMNDLRKSYEFAERLCPTVYVPGAHGRYKKFDDVDSFQVYATGRGLGADPTRIQFGAEDEYYNCAPQALEIMGVTVLRLDRPEDAEEVISAAASLAFESDQQVAVLISQRMLGRKKWTETL